MCHSIKCNVNRFVHLTGRTSQRVHSGEDRISPLNRTTTPRLAQNTKHGYSHQRCRQQHSESYVQKETL